MKIATWNINGLKARREELLRWLQEKQPDVMGLQEIKTDNEQRLSRFQDDLQELGYHARFHSEPSHNGVGILSKSPLEVTQGRSVRALMLAGCGR